MSGASSCWRARSPIPLTARGWCFAGPRPRPRGRSPQPTPMSPTKSSRAGGGGRGAPGGERGELVLAGALADPVDGAVLVFRGPTPQAAEAFARADPYVANKLVTRWRVRKWTTVVGEGVTSP